MKMQSYIKLEFFQVLDVFFGIFFTENILFRFFFFISFQHLLSMKLILYYYFLLEISAYLLFFFK